MPDKIFGFYGSDADAYQRHPVGLAPHLHNHSPCNQFKPWTIATLPLPFGGIEVYILWNTSRGELTTPILNDITDRAQAIGLRPLTPIELEDGSTRLNAGHHQ